MSYILDALKKAERERGLTQMPRLTAAHDLRGAQRNRLAVIAGGLLVSAAAVLLFFLPALNTIFRPPKTAPNGTEQNRIANRPEAKPFGDPASVNSASRPLIPPEPHAPMKAGRSQDTAAPDPSEIRSSPRSTAAAPPEAGVVAQDAAERVSPEGGHRASSSPPGEAMSQRTAPEPVGLPPAEKAPPQTASSTTGAATKEVMPAPRENQPRPASLQDAMARMTLNILVYEEAEADRKVYINGKKYVKGDFIEGHYLIENITLEGAVLSYEGVRGLLRPR
jgi:general secretion pathway protein B